MIYMCYLPSVSTVQPHFSSIFWNLEEITAASRLRNAFLYLFLDVPVLDLDQELPPGHIISSYCMAESFATTLGILFPFLLSELAFKEFLSPHWDLELPFVLHF